MYAKGARYFEDEPVADSSIEDLDMDFVTEYCDKIGYKKSAEEYIRKNKKFYITHNGKEELSVAAVLLFAKNPQLYFPRARVRFIRYEGTEAKVGTEMNVIKDVVFSGRILEMVAKSINILKNSVVRENLTTFFFWLQSNHNDVSLWFLSCSTISSQCFKEVHSCFMMFWKFGKSGCKV